MNYRVPRTRKEIFETLIKGLQRLEYRGYDSAGVAIDGNNNEVKERHMQLVKKRGNVKALDEELYKQDSMDLKVEFETHFGIAHTRWATHGVPSAVNSHPQRSDKGNGMWFSLAPRPSGCDWPRDVCVRIDPLSTPTGFSAALSLLSIQTGDPGPWTGGRFNLASYLQMPVG